MKNKIFLVDDEPEILEDYCFFLKEDFSLHTFSNPEYFLKYFDAKEFTLPDLVITDFSMPKLTGLEMIERAHKKNIHFPFIVLSGFLNKENIMKAVDLGVHKLLEKPVNHNLLRASIDQILLEYEVFKSRKEILQITSQMREVYAGVRLIMQQFIPQDVLERMIIDAPQGVVKEKIDLDELFSRLEKRLEHLLMKEKLLLEISQKPHGLKAS